MILQCRAVAVTAQFAYRTVAAARHGGGNAPVPALYKYLRRLIGGGIVINGDGGIILLAQGAEAVGVGAAHIRHAYQRQLRRGVIEPAAEEDEPAQLFLAFKYRARFHLVRVGVDKVQHHCIAALLYLPRHGFQQLGKEEVARPAHYHAYCGRLTAHKVARAVVGDIPLGLHHTHHPPAHLSADIGAVVQHAGHGAHAHPAHLCNVFYRHVLSRPDERTVSPSFILFFRLTLFPETLPVTFPIPLWLNISKLARQSQQHFAAKSQLWRYVQIRSRFFEHNNNTRTAFFTVRALHISP